MIGAAFAQQQGLGVLLRLRQETAKGQLPTTTLVDALMIFMAGALLITPGVLTDLFGFTLLIPWCRRRTVRHCYTGFASIRSSPHALSCQGRHGSTAQKTQTLNPLRTTAST